ncbi:hypothetical protein PV325_002001 [Microctonus aethiopoides]|nr:hypothetical protein PV325_002001 [Microctonus aethiopoides]
MGHVKRIGQLSDSSKIAHKMFDQNAEEARKKRQRCGGSQGGQRGTNCGDQPQPTAGSMQSCNKIHRGPSKLFERAPLQPSDSLDEIAFQIPRNIGGQEVAE